MKNKTYHIITYGCQMNESDSERIAGKLEKRNYKESDKAEKADLIIINICSVRQSAIHRVYDKIKKIRQINPKAKIICTGCILEKDKIKFRKQTDAIWTFPGLEIEPKLKCLPALPTAKPLQAGKHRVFVPIMTGCDNFCSYCAVPYTRGRERSRKADNIIRDIKKLVKKDYREITLLGQNVNSYFDKNKKIDFARLLQLIDNIPGKFKIKFLTNHPKDMTDKLIKTIAQANKITKEIHLPLQSGDDRILEKMNRRYTVGKYKKLIKKIRQYMPKARISSDIIVGFPTETKKQFQNTVDLIKEINFSQIYVAAYSSRPGTAAAKLPDAIPSLEKKRRKKIILELVKKQ